MKALLVVDMINEYIYGERPLIYEDKREELISNIKKVAELARSKKIPVVFVNSAFEKDDPILRVIGEKYHAMKGENGSQIISGLRPFADYVIEKRGYDGFWESDLEKLLKKLKTKDIYLVGEQTDCCVRETGVTAAHLGYNVFVIEDCCSSNRGIGHKTAIEFMESCVGKVVNSKDLDW